MVPLILLVLFTGLIRGVVQGMVMSMGSDITSKTVYNDGVRNHVFFSFYHAINFTLILCLISLSIAFHNIYSSSSVVSFVPFFIGSMILLWRAFEISYSLSRWAKIRAYENVVILDIISFRIIGVKQIIWTFVWIVVGVWLLILGGF